MTYLHTEFYTPNTNGSLVINIKRKAEYEFLKSAMFLFDIKQIYILFEDY
jgi:hypothetical protein